VIDWAVSRNAAGGGNAPRIFMSWWMYVGPAMAGFLGGLAIGSRLPGYEPKRHERLAVSLGLGLAIICPLAVCKLSPATSVPFWVSLVIFAVALFSFGDPVRGPATERPRAALAKPTTPLFDRWRQERKVKMPKSKLEDLERVPLHMNATERYVVAAELAHLGDRRALEELMAPLAWSPVLDHGTHTVGNCFAGLHQ
jgi:hypothetical protein